MDRIQESSDLIAEINKFRNGTIPDYEVIKSVCNYFDLIKEDSLTASDVKFLKHISNAVGIPHYFDLLGKFNEKDRTISDFDLNTLSSIIYESTLYTNSDTKVHRYQKNISDMFVSDRRNRFFLSASTSFGKTHLVYEIIRKMQYKNIMLIFPTIALLGENLERIISEPEYTFFKDNYQIHTLSEVASYGERNLFIFTPERYLSYIEKNDNAVIFDFSFIDEIYKIDNDYLIDEASKENERDVAYRIALFYTLLKNSDVLLAGPYIEFSKTGSQSLNTSFSNFLSRNEFTLLNFNDYEIVSKSFTDIKSKSNVRIDDKLSFDFSSNSKEERLITIIDNIKAISDKENCIIYCSSKSGVESYARKIFESGILNTHNSSEYDDFIKHVESRFKSEWVVVKALRNGIGIHHGLVPKYIQKEIIRLFNDGALRVLISTTTITEGVNTSAKNLVVLHDKKGTKNLKKFDAKNISGRAGRFNQHYNGRVIVLKNKFMDVIEGPSNGIQHKNYDSNSPKDEIDLFYTDEEYLNQNDKTKIAQLKIEQDQRNIPDEIFKRFKVISRHDKLRVYDRIKELSPADLQDIRNLIARINFSMDVHYDGFQTVLNVIEPIVKEGNKMLFLITNRSTNNFGTKQYSSLTHLVHYYLQGGFIGSLNHKINSQNMTIDEAMKQTAEFVYNILKYQVVKYIGVFNIMYKFYISQVQNIPFDDVPGLDSLLIKLEYNALTENGRIASDYGVPANIIDYYELPETASAIKTRFDKYENEVFLRIEKIIKKQ
jgi:hypothetical protein